MGQCQGKDPNANQQNQRKINRAPATFGKKKKTNKNPGLIGILESLRMKSMHMRQR